MHSPRGGLLALHSSILLFGLTALFSKLIALSALEITLLRSLFAALALAALIRWSGSSLALGRSRDYALVLLLGALLAMHWATYFHSMQVSTIAVGVIALHTFPVMTVFLEPLFHGARPHLRDVVSAVAVLVGIYLLVPEFSLDDSVSHGVLWGLLSALLYALRNIVQRRYLSHQPASKALFYQTAVVFAVLLPISGGGVDQVEAWQWGQLLVLGLFFTALPHSLFAHGLRHFPAKTASLVACLQVVYATAFAALFLRELPTTSTLIGGLVVVGAAMFESYTAGRDAARRRG